MDHISLAGEWQATWTDGQHGRLEQLVEPVQDPHRYMVFSFPGTIHAGLEKAGLVQDPRIGISSLHARWVEEQFWLLRRSFTLTQAAANGPVFLHIDVLDGVAQVAVNGNRAGTHANANRPGDFDLTGKVVEGENEIAILLESGLFHVADLPGRDYSQNLETILNKRHQLRQSQYQFGWDWNPRLVTMGMHGNIELVAGEGVWLRQVQVTSELSEDLGKGQIRLHLDYFFSSSKAQRANLVVQSIDGLEVRTELQLEPGCGECEATLAVPNPQLWWPRGYGEPNLYPLHLQIHAGEEVLASWAGRTGLRRVEIDQPVHPEAGHYFRLKINHQPVFCKGANWVPPELCGHAVTNERIARLVSLAEAENMNMLRVWGGGVWANHPLLGLCDERGILVWHDLLFACSKYPADRPDFLAEVEREVAWGIREFSSHPSLAVWCGNNELEWGLWGWGYKNFGKTAPDSVLFHHIFPRLMASLDPSRPYWPSSPYSGPAVSPNEPTTGDQHPWNVSLGADDVDFWAYRNYVDRFPNEGGVLGCAPVASLRKFLDTKELKLRSFAWEHHDNTVLYWQSKPGLPYRAVEHWLGRQPGEMGLEEYTLASGLLQAEGLKEYIANYRRRWPSTSSAIYWMFNDSWPTVHGWGTIDYYLNRKPAFHPVRRAFADQVVVLADEGDQIGVYVVNDSRQELKCTVDLGDFTATGPAQLRARLDLSIAPFSSIRAGEMPRDPERIDYAVLRDANGGLLAQERLLLRPFKEWEVTPRPDIRVSVVKTASGSKACYTCDTWVWGVVLDPSGELAVQDDVFDLLPGIPYEVAFGADEEPLPVKSTGNSLFR